MTNVFSNKDPEKSPEEKAKTEGNQCIALGLGVGGLGAVAAIGATAICPICVVVAPSLVAVGLYRRWTAGKANKP